VNQGRLTFLQYQDNNKFYKNTDRCKGENMNHSKNISNTNELPKNYRFSHKFDLKTHKKISLLIQVIFMIIALSMVGLAIGFDFPIKSDMKTITKIIITVGLVIIYMILHELIHGVTIQLLSKKKPNYSFRFPYLITGSQSYFNKKSFFLIALAPVIMWGTILLIAILFVSNTLFLSFYIVLGFNFAGSAGDYVQVYYLSKLPSDVLLQDDGYETKVFVVQ
jgi:hypothetical protein